MKLSLIAALLLAASVSTPTAYAHPVQSVRSGPFSLQLVDESGNVLRTFQHRGRTYVLGAPNQRYLLRVRNDSPRRVEAVASVDGRDVVDGKLSGLDKRGYLIEPWSDVLIDGFRTSQVSVAAFRFSSVSQSYASQMGSARDVGVIGVAVFSEDGPVDAPPQRMEQEGHLGTAGSSGAEGASPPSAAPAAREAQASRKSGRSADDSRSGLGTRFAEEHSSHVRNVEFVRAAANPAATLTLRYNDRRGLRALGIDVDGDRYRSETHLRETAEPFRHTRYAQPPPSWNR